MALHELVAAIGDVRVGVLVADSPSVPSDSLLRALIDPTRLNRPTAAQIIELTNAAERVISPVVAAIEHARRIADDLRRATAA